MAMLVVKNFCSSSFEECQVQIQIIKDLESRYVGRVVFENLNSKENEGLIEKYRIRNYPTMIIECNGVEKERFVGLTQELFLKRALDKVLSECK